MKIINNITILDGNDIQKIEIKECDWCNEKEVVYGLCDKHYEYFEKHQYDDL